MEIFRKKMATLPTRKYRGHSNGSKRVLFEADNSSPSSRLLKGRYEPFVSLFTAAICPYTAGISSAEAMAMLEKTQYAERFKLLFPLTYLIKTHQGLDLHFSIKHILQMTVSFDLSISKTTLWSVYRSKWRNMFEKRFSYWLQPLQFRHTSVV